MKLQVNQTQLKLIIKDGITQGRPGKKSYSYFGHIDGLTVRVFSKNLLPVMVEEKKNNKTQQMYKYSFVELPVGTEVRTLKSDSWCPNCSNHKPVYMATAFVGYEKTLKVNNVEKEEEKEENLELSFQTEEV